MLFNSYIFIFIFLPLVLIGWYGLNKLSRPVFAMTFLSIMSLWFYGYFNPSYLLIIISSIIINYLISFLFDKWSKLWQQKMLLTVGLIFNLGLLFAFKYYDFFIENINAVFHADFNLKHILLPLGISFFTFQQISFIVDRYKKEAKHYSFVNYMTFVTFFPQLIAGPIVLYDEVMPQFENPENRKFNSESFAGGLWIFSVGLAKKVLLADVMAVFVNRGYDNYLLMDTTTSLLVIVFYALELYFDFSGYSDMAIGLGKMFNIELPVNFNSPYKAATVKELWQRWHITLSRFFVRYVYIPMGGSRKGKVRTLFNVFFIFLLSGFWHGANWTYVIWGAMQGIILVWDNLYIIGATNSNSKQKPRLILPKCIGQFLTFDFFAFSLIVFRSENIQVAVSIFKNIFSFTNSGFLNKMFDCFEVPEIYVITQAFNIFAPSVTAYILPAVMILLLLIGIFILTRRNTIELCKRGLTVKSFVFSGILLVWSILSFSQVSTFIYFNF